MFLEWVKPIKNINAEAERWKHQKIRRLKQTLLKVVLFYGTLLPEIISKRFTKVAKPGKNVEIQIADLLDAFIMAKVVNKVKTGN